LIFCPISAAAATDLPACAAPQSARCPNPSPTPPRPRSFALAIEPLETRQLLTAVTVEAIQPIATESGDAAVFKISRTGTTGSLQGHWQITNGTTNDDDFGSTANMSGSFVIPDGESSIQVFIGAANDLIAEDTEPFTSRPPPTTRARGRRRRMGRSRMTSRASGSEATDASASEDNQDPGQFEIHLTRPAASNLYVFYQLSGTATHGTMDGSTGAVTPADADYLGGDPDPNNPGRFQAFIPAGGSAAFIDIAPLNDAENDEGTETITLTLLADPSPDGPFYFAPGDAGPAAANVPLQNLRITSNLLEVPYSTLDDILARLGAETNAEREQAQGELIVFLTQYPYTSVEQYCSDKAEATGGSEKGTGAFSLRGSGKKGREPFFHLPTWASSMSSRTRKD
jgi:hypothetical protein